MFAQRRNLIIFILTVVIAFFGVFFVRYGIDVPGDDTSRSTERALKASRDVSALRELTKSEFSVKVTLRDGTERTIKIPRRSVALDPENSIELYHLPTADQVYAADLKGTDLVSASSSVVNVTGITQLIEDTLGDELHEPTPARYVFSDGRVLVADDAPGQTIDVLTVASKIEHTIRTLGTDTSISIETQDTPAGVSAKILREHIDAARVIAGASGYRLKFDKYSWTLSGRDIFAMLGVATSSGAFSVDEDLLRARVKLLANSLITNPVSEPRFDVDAKGNLYVAEEGKVGRDIDIASLRTDIENWANAIRIAVESGVKPELASRDHTLTLTSTMPHLSLTALVNYGIDTRIGAASTSFKGSSKDRITNISLGASRVTGFIVRPGEEFSLVRAIGFMEKENGYKEEYVIKGGRSRKEAGGGLCQLATTFFRTALDSGVKITERHNHLYVVGYYGPGLDAGIYDIDHDFRFVNDYSAPILVQAMIKGTSLVVEFYSRSDGRVARTSAPLVTDVLPPPPPDYRFSDTIDFKKTECTDHPREGMTTYATTTITYRSGDAATRVWTSVYAPWPKICLIGTKGLSVFQEDN